MGDRKITLLELHLDGETQFGPSALPNVTGGPGESEEGDSDTEDEGGAGAPVRGVLGLLALLFVVVAVKKLVGGSGDEFESTEA
jgi:hypothetical protein